MKNVARWLKMEPNTPPTMPRHIAGTSVIKCIQIGKNACKMSITVSLIA